MYKTKLKGIVSIFLAVILFTSNLSAIGLVTEVGVGDFARKSNVKLAEGADLYINTLKHVTAGQTEERYIEYTPGSQVVPVVAYGTQLYGMSTISYVASYLQSNSQNVVAGVNGDFFMTDTGIPIGMVVTDGILRTSDVGGNNIGFNSDGSAFIGKPALQVNLTTDTGYSVRLDYVNKTRRNYGTYLLTPDFSANTRTTTPGISILLNNISGDLKIGQSITADVGTVIKGTESSPLLAGTMVLTATDENNLAARLEPIASASKVTISITSADPRWNDVVYAVGAGDTLVEEGVVNSSLPTGTAPRTAFGITDEGKIITYTVDGRQAGYSAGMNLKTLAERMVSLGCVNAVNLDGGGSTTMVAGYPGYDTLSTINSPSEGTLRRGANYLFFVNTAEKTNVAQNLHLYPFDSMVLAGSQLQYSVKATDSAYYPVQYSGHVNYGLSSTSADISNTGLLTAGPNEDTLNITASTGSMTAQGTVRIIETPTTLDIINEATKKAVKTLSVSSDEVIDLSVSAKFNGVQVNSTDTALTWQVLNTVGDIGKIDETGQFIASAEIGSTGKIIVTTGSLSVEVPVQVGMADILINAFEKSSNLYTTGDGPITVVPQTDKNYVKYGDRSAKVLYSFPEATPGAQEVTKLSTPSNIIIPQNRKFLKLWIYGDGSGNNIGFNLIKGSTTVQQSLGVLDFTGYKYVEFPLTADITSISGLYIERLGAQSGTVYLDHIMSSYTPGADTEPPTIIGAKLDTTISPGSATVSATILDKGFIPVAQNYVTASLDGVSTTFSYSQNTGMLNATIPIPNDGMLHKITITAVDVSGNRARQTLEVAETAYNQVFIDSKGHWSESNANYLNARGVLNGVVREDGVYFNPDKSMTRAEFAQMMSNYLGLSTTDFSEVQLPYADLDSIPNWSLNAVAAMYSKGIIKGKATAGALVYDPNANITRAEVMTILGRTLPKGFSPAEITFSDSAKVPAYAAEYVGTLIGMGILSGYNDGTLRPNNFVNRSEAAKMMAGFY